MTLCDVQYKPAELCLVLCSPRGGITDAFLGRKQLLCAPLCLESSEVGGTPAGLCDGLWVSRGAVWSRKWLMWCCVVGGVPQWLTNDGRGGYFLTNQMSLNGL